MTREDNNSLVEMLAKIPVTETKGSLLSAIGKLLRVIDISESSIMIPTLLKDKCEFDANEMLTLAKILKASILGHNDLVEFYLSESSSQNSNNTQLAHHQHPLNNNTNSSSSSSNYNNSNNNHNHLPQHQQQHQLQHHSATNNHNNNNNNSVLISQGMIGNGLIGSNGISSNSSSGVGGSGGSGSGGSGNGVINNNNNNGIHKHQLNHLNPIHQLSATPSLKSSGSSESTSSSPCTPQPPGAESIGSSSSQLQLWKQQQHQRGVNSDPDATVRLLLQIEQLKIFIPQVTGIFESIIELYKNSVDTITYGGGGGGGRGLSSGFSSK